MNYCAKVRISEEKTKFIWVFSNGSTFSEGENLLLFTFFTFLPFYFFTFFRTFAAATMGVTGFDGKPKWYVSMRSDDCVLHNQVGRKINWQQ